MRLIDAEALDSGLLVEGLSSALTGGYPRRRKFTIGEIRGLLQRAPTINAVPVVRCGECEHYRAQEIIDGEPRVYVCCRTNGYSTGDNHFCAWGIKGTQPKEKRLTASCLARYYKGDIKPQNAKEEEHNGQSN